MSRFPLLKEGLDRLYEMFDRAMLSPDPLECVPLAGNFHDRELSAFLASAFAYGRADLIVRNVRYILGEMGGSPHRTLMEGTYRRKFRNYAYRFHKRGDMIWLLDRLREIYRSYGSLENAFCAAGGTTRERLVAFSLLFRKNRKAPGAVRGFLVPSPEGNSACKRMNLFLRWMVRKDGVDLGLWKKLEPRELVMPLDVHVNRIARRLGLVGERGAANFAKALELTDALRRFDPVDPVRYDFAICSLGKLGYCLKRPEVATCELCVMEKACSKN